ncbi:MAG: creatininase family protein, partial [Bacteroidota bacterium]
RWDELTATDWPAALERSASTCILPIGVLEKHGPHVPIGSDLIHVREWAKRATAREYAVVFPDYFYGQIYEARHQPGTFALPSRLVWDMLETTCDEIARNGLERETSTMLYLRPDLVQLDRADRESGKNQKRLSIPDLYTGIWWYASYPNHYAGEGSAGTRELGELVTEHRIESLVNALKTVKADTKTLELQKEFFDRVK